MPEQKSNLFLYCAELAKQRDEAVGRVSEMRTRIADSKWLCQEAAGCGTTGRHGVRKEGGYTSVSQGP